MITYFLHEDIMVSLCKNPIMIQVDKALDEMLLFFTIISLFLVGLIFASLFKVILEAAYHHLKRKWGRIK